MGGVRIPAPWWVPGGLSPGHAPRCADPYTSHPRHLWAALGIRPRDIPERPLWPPHSYLGWRWSPT